MPTASVPIVPNSTVATGQSMREFRVQNLGFRDEEISDLGLRTADWNCGFLIRISKSATRNWLLRTGGGWDDRSSCAGCRSSSACDAIVDRRIGPRRGVVRCEIGWPRFHVG